MTVMHPVLINADVDDETRRALEDSINSNNSFECESDYEYELDSESESECEGFLSEIIA